MSYNRYNICWVELDPVRDSELSKTRPAVIVSLDVLNRALETVVICPLTTRLHQDWRTRLQVKLGGKRAEIRNRASGCSCDRRMRPRPPRPRSAIAATNL
ncbi:MAG: type II toxin-antitoxin system PemK/MazF family toxin [Verrucomicrobia bacterium]|nr:type II toxin-antitoxin system PemK/MazF family toxin [Verrucomicrobiota bacterium]